MADAYSTKIYNTGMGKGPLKNVQHLSASASATSAVAFVGPVAVRVLGDLGGGTVVVQALTSGSTYGDVADTTATAAYGKLIDFPPGSRNTLQVLLTGGAAASCDVILQGYQG